MLIVDDKFSLTHLVAEYLQSKGFDTLTDLILLDIMMPHMDGFGFIKTFRKECNTPIILLTAKVEETDAVVVAVVSGLLFMRTLLRPLASLSTAITKMEQGELQQEVPPTSNYELGEVIEGFNQMSTALATAKARRDQMPADIAHEQRSPLTVINGYLETMQDSSLENQKDIIDVQSLFTHIGNAYALQAEAKGIHLRFIVEPSDHKLVGDEGRIIQVLSNLINNAFRHTLQSGIITV